MFISKGSYWFGELKNVIAYSVQFNVLAVTGLPSLRFQAVSYRADDENLAIFVATYHRGTVYALRQCLYQKEATGMESLKM